MKNAISNITKNCMGTVSFDGLFGTQRKAQDFIVYPLNTSSRLIRIQSDKRAGFIDIEDGRVSLSNHPQMASKSDVICTLTAETLLMLKAAVFGTASGKAGTNGVVYCDNSAAIDVFGTQQ